MSGAFAIFGPTQRCSAYVTGTPVVNNSFAGTIRNCQLIEINVGQSVVFNIPLKQFICRHERLEAMDLLDQRCAQERVLADIGAKVKENSLFCKVWCESLYK